MDYAEFVISLFLSLIGFGAGIAASSIVSRYVAKAKNHQNSNATDEHHLGVEPEMHQVAPVLEAEECSSDVAEVLFFPDIPKACQGYQMYGTCHTFGCKRKHEDTNGKRLYDFISRAQVSVDIAAQAITSHQIANALTDLRSRGVSVRIIRDYENLRILKQGNKIHDLKEIGVEMKVSGIVHEKHVYTFGLFHHKFIVLDKSYVITGSLNYTLKGVVQNYECCLVTNVPSVVKGYASHFEYLWEHEASFPKS